MLREDAKAVVDELFADWQTPPVVRVAEGAVLDEAQAKAAFDAWSEGLPLVEDVWSYAGTPAVFRLLHGTAADFEAFSHEHANPEGDWGAGFYFTSEESDASSNYAGLGPDLTNKIEWEAEREHADRQWQAQDDQDGADADPISLETVIEEVKKRRMAHEGVILPVFVKSRRPAIMGGPAETFFDMELGEEDGESTGLLVDFIEALREASSGFDDGDITKVEQEMFEQGLDGGLGFSELREILCKDEKFSYYTDNQGRLVSKEIFRRALAGCGFDAVVDYTVGWRFCKMRGIGDGTAHVIAFSNTQMKSSLGNRGTYALDDPNLLTSRSATGQMEGATTGPGGEVVLIADALSDARHARFVVLHEVVGHQGIRAVLQARGGDEGGFEQELAKLRTHPFIQRMVEVVGVARAMDLSDPKALARATEEAAAELAAACATRDYGRIRQNYGMAVPLSVRPGIIGALVRFAQRVVGALLPEGVKGASSFSDTQWLELLSSGCQAAMMRLETNSVWAAEQQAAPSQVRSMRSP